MLFLGYSFGLPAIAADVGSLREEIIEGETGFVFKARDSSALAQTIEQYFASELFRQLERRRPEIKAYASERYSWNKSSGNNGRGLCESALAGREAQAAVSEYGFKEGIGSCFCFTSGLQSTVRKLAQDERAPIVKTAALLFDATLAGKSPAFR